MERWCQAGEETWYGCVSERGADAKGPQSQLTWSQSGSWTARQGSFLNMHMHSQDSPKGRFTQTGLLPT